MARISNPWNPLWGSRRCIDRARQHKDSTGLKLAGCEGETTGVVLSFANFFLGEAVLWIRRPGRPKGSVGLKVALD